MNTEEALQGYSPAIKFSWGRVLREESILYCFINEYFLYLNSFLPEESNVLLLSLNIKNIYLN